jgi:hypothetical protein
MAFLKILSGFYLFFTFYPQKNSTAPERAERNSLKLSAKGVTRSSGSAQNCFPRKTQIVSFPGRVYFPFAYLQ